MTANPFELVLRRIVDITKTLARHRMPVALIGLALTLVLALAYVMIDSLRINPARGEYTVKVLLRESGGLIPAQDVTLRGVPIGRVQSVNLSGNTVTAVVAIDSDTKIPANTAARVSALTAAGEQYLDLRPTDDHGPYLSDGATIAENRTTVPVPFNLLLDHAEGLLNQVDPAKVDTIIKELHVSPGGPKKLEAIVEGGTFLISTLDSVLPETVSTIRSSRTVFTTLTDTRRGLQATAGDLRQVLGGVSRMDGGFRRLVDTAPHALQQIDNIIADNSDTMVALLGNLTTVAQLSYVRVPALKALFPTDRPSVLDGIALVVHDGGIWGIADGYPRYACDYNRPHLPSSTPDFPEPYRYSYCENPDPAVLIRGARNAPRPPGDDTAGPPPGYDPLAKTDPTPVGPHSVPLTVGGPELPFQPPN
ncbi:MlaD family protein [Mycolicibacterium sp. CBMA 226]|uniref:MlaD family protein n=1 Tax=Mycolicibacterium sp. CBMA 226 TaxID=2606611 RepID=UPI0012DF7D2E|nr:MCE family protein [Mycolicibacterium sp. CBMA 226]MUL78719.1 MCE family protein [Mycolicibacterium sp. CBMA 226]